MVQDHVFINGKKILVSDWSFTVFQLCDSLDIKIPRFCYHERLSIAGNCRMCMVEVSSAIKPLVSCATPLSKGMSILTDSALVRKAREGVLEFLLINHPLDCPICDQGGECDLQDQSIVYGADKGRFLETKRSVEDKNFGPIVKTVMTRCIHCTRCVRFFEEIAGNPVIGTMGRGKDTEISTYLSNSILSSNISGNVIDLCPVGALTSKPHAFLYRSWELVGSESIDTLDSLCSNIRVDMKGSEIVRVLPRRNDLINQDWITDRTRYSFDGLKNQRFSYPMKYTKEDGCFRLSNWSSFFSSYRLNSLNSINSSSYGQIALGSGLDLYTVYLSDLLSRASSHLHLSGNINTSIVDFRSSYLSSCLSSIQSSSVLLLSGLDIKHSFSLLNVRVQQKVNSKDSCSVLYNGKSRNFGYDVFHFGLTYESTFSLLRGKSSFSSFLSNNKHINMFSCVDFRSFSSVLPSKININTNVLLANTSSLASSELGVSPSNLLGSCSFYYGLNVSNCSQLDTVSHCVFHSTHSDLSLSSVRSHTNLLSVWYLPSFSSFETELPYINLLGMIQWTRKCSSSFGESSTYEDVLRRLISISSCKHSDVSFDRFLSKVPSLVEVSLPVVSFDLSNSFFSNETVQTCFGSDVPYSQFSFVSLKS